MLGIPVFQSFKIREWPKEDYGKFYNGDSYIILNVSLLVLWKHGFYVFYIIMKIEYCSCARGEGGPVVWHLLLPTTDEQLQ